MDRRTFCVTGVAALSGAAAGLACLPAMSAPGIPIYKIIYDRRFCATREFGRAAGYAPSRAGTVAIDGDITGLWSEDLRLHWSEGGGAIAGMTSARSAFCLEQLARDHWRRTLIRIEHAALDSTTVAHRITAPEPMIMRVQSVLAAGDWPAKLPAALTDGLLADRTNADFASMNFASADRAPRAARLTASTRDIQRAMPQESLVTFVIA
jgi:hypothetical protein